MENNIRETNCKTNYNIQFNYKAVFAKLMFFYQTLWEYKTEIVPKKEKKNKKISNKL